MKVHVTAADDPTDDRVVSHFSSIAMPGGGAGGRTALSVVDAG
jgi:cyclic dehypoxanthinyl futalosine synthase